jgi:hypothetical protein
MASDVYLPAEIIGDSVVCIVKLKISYRRMA